MHIDLRELYKRYNQFEEYENAFPVSNQYIMLQVYNDVLLTSQGIDEKIGILERNRIERSMRDFQEIKQSSEEVQPKSVFLRIQYLSIIAKSIPAAFFSLKGIHSESIVEISLSIALYYLGLENYSFGKRLIDETQKKNILRSTDFSFDLEDICLVRGKTTEDEFSKFTELFGKDVNQIKENESIGLYRENARYFVLCVPEFLDYMLFELESLFLESAGKEERDRYFETKGLEFEKTVSTVMEAFFEEVFHTAFYIYNEKKMEVDVIARDKKDLLVLECKSGSFYPAHIEEDSAMRLILRNKTRKAYKTLMTVSRYLQGAKYTFACLDRTIEGATENPICIHVSMYPMDFVSSNIHTLFPDYLEESSPILSISFEHLFAMLLDAVRNDRSIWEYWKKRKEDIVKYPSLRFDENELDLYYEVVNEDKGSMLNLIRKNGLLDNLSPNGIIVSSFHDERGKEMRPANNMLKVLDCVALEDIMTKGKSQFGINKRYLSNLDEFIRVSN